MPSSCQLLAFLFCAMTGLQGQTEGLITPECQSCEPGVGCFDHGPRLYPNGTCECVCLECGSEAPPCNPREVCQLGEPKVDPTHPIACCRPCQETSRRTDVVDLSNTAGSQAATPLCLAERWGTYSKINPDSCGLQLQARWRNLLPGQDLTQCKRPVQKQERWVMAQPCSMRQQASAGRLSSNDDSTSCSTRLVEYARLNLPNMRRSSQNCSSNNWVEIGFCGHHGSKGGKIAIKKQQVQCQDGSTEFVRIGSYESCSCSGNGIVEQTAAPVEFKFDLLWCNAAPWGGYTDIDNKCGWQWQHRWRRDVKVDNAKLCNPRPTEQDRYVMLRPCAADTAPGALCRSVTTHHFVEVALLRHGRCRSLSREAVTHCTGNCARCDFDWTEHQVRTKKVFVVCEDKTWQVVRVGLPRRNSCACN